MRSFMVLYIRSEIIRRKMRANDTICEGEFPSIVRAVLNILLFRWMEAILMETLPPVTELEDRLSNGVLLCALGKKLLPNDPMWKKVFDQDQAKFKVRFSSLPLLFM